MSSGNSLIGARASMEPAGFDLDYHGEDGSPMTLASPAFAPCETDDVRVDAAFDGEVLEVGVTPKRRLCLDGFHVKLRHAFATGEMVLLSGSQSWDDTVERQAWGHMLAFNGAPRDAARRLASDVGKDGEGRFEGRVPQRAGQCGFAYATFRRGEGCVLVGSLDESHGFTTVCANAPSGEVIVAFECPVGVVQAGKRAVFARIAVTRGTLDECYERWFSLSGCKARPVMPLVGYTSWRRHRDGVDECKLLSDLEGAQKFFDELDADLRPCTKLFQVGPGWCKTGDWLRVDARKFPRGLAPLAESIRRAGFVLGLWVAPYACERDSRLFRERAEWLLRDGEGEPVLAGDHRGECFVLDTRNVEARSYVLEVLQEITRGWGFGLVKADLLHAACIRPHGGMNRGELMADALDLLRVGIGEETLLHGCGAPLASAFGKVDYCGIGCDGGFGRDGRPSRRLPHRVEPAANWMLANAYGRAPLDGRAFGSDPGASFLRPSEGVLHVGRPDQVLSAAELGSVLLVSDDMGAWGESRRSLYRAALSVLLDRFRKASR